MTATQVIVIMARKQEQVAKSVGMPVTEATGVERRARAIETARAGPRSRLGSIGSPFFGLRVCAGTWNASDSARSASIQRRKSQ